MAKVLMNSRANVVFSNGYPCYLCSSYEDSRTKDSRSLKLGSLNCGRKTNFCAISGGIVYSHGGLKRPDVGLCHESLLNGSPKLLKLIKSKVMVASIEHGLVCELGEVPLIREDEEDEVEEEQPLWGSAPLDRGIEFGVRRSKSPSMVSKWDETRLYYLEERDEEALSKRIVALSQTNKRASALALFRSMEFAGLWPNIHACNSLLSCLSRSNMLNELLMVFAFMKQNDIISGHSCSLVLKAVASSRGSDVALQMFLEWQKENKMRQNFDVIVYNTMISICGKANKWVQMEWIWTSMKESGIIGTTVTYRVLVCTFVRCGWYEMAIDAYCEMLQNGVKPGYDAMQAIIGGYAKEEQWESALNVFHHAFKCSLKPNLIACNALINSLGKAGKVKEAFKVYKCIRSLGHEPDSYTWNALLGAFYRAKQYANALQLFDSIQTDFSFKPNIHLYNTALMCCQRLAFWDEALQLLWKMESSGIPASTTSYNIVISACEVARKPKIALQVYKHMTYKNYIPDTFTNLSLIRSCIWGDLWDEVTGILDRSTPDVSLYNAAIHGMCLKGKYESAKKLYWKMRDIGLVPDGSQTSGENS
ncbi:hypothetical protein Cgig2_014467 [Carnegiea gigantea]|uniref:Pentatricopeptide repeat-containing protein n=1 Tax=Carnegiea gigantea TaxID=171969 RepID=A0A9Q1QEE3_9CARY|nr:hypothetical protein Cgig2_014467 [Carnegiea gigantea]